MRSPLDEAVFDEGSNNAAHTASWFAVKTDAFPNKLILLDFPFQQAVDDTATVETIGIAKRKTFLS